MIDTHNKSNRRIIMSAAMLNAYHQDADKANQNDNKSSEGNEAEYQSIDDQGYNPTYELGYN